MDLRALIRRKSIENPLWGVPRIHGELLKLGFASSIRAAKSVRPMHNAGAPISVVYCFKTFSSFMEYPFAFESGIIRGRRASR